MGKQTIEQRVAKIANDFLKNPHETDIRARWQKVVEDGVADEVIAALGPMPTATLDDIPLSDAVQYAGRDADATWRLKPVLWKRILEMGLDGVYAMDMACVPMFERMQANGMRVNTQRLWELSSVFEGKMHACVAALTKWTHNKEFNPGSGDQVADFLFRHLHLTSRRMTKGGKRESTDDKTLESLRRVHPAVPHVLDYRKFAKLKTGFCDTLPAFADEHGRIHGTFKITRVSSGRLSVTDPALLTIPVRDEDGKLIRTAFVPRDGFVMGSWDLDQIELRELAHQTQDPRMLKLFREGVDIHAQSGAWMFGVKLADVTPTQRRAAKTINFAIVYGITPVGLADSMAAGGAEGWTEDRCEEAQSEWHKIYTRMKPFMMQVHAEVRRNEYVRDRWGRIRYLPGIHSEIPRVRAEAERQAVSFKISASAQGTMKHAMAAIWQWWRENQLEGVCEPLLQIHDELLWELRPHMQEFVGQDIKAMMEYTTTMSVPIKAKFGFGENWGVLKD